MNFYQAISRWLRRLMFALGMFAAMPASASCPVAGEAALISATPGLVLTMTVDRSGAKPGDVLLYTLVFCNAAGAAISNVRIDGATPAATDFVSASCGELPPDIACIVGAQPAPGGDGVIVWTLSGALQPGISGTVNFKVSVR